MSEASDREPGIPASGEPSGGLDPEAIADADLPEPLDEDLVRERDEMRALAQRVQADFENYRKRVLREQTALVDRATEGLIEQLLPVLDSFELAVANLDDTVDEKVRKGIELAFAELNGVLERAGLERIKAAGEPFDPNEHDAVLQDDGDGEPHVAEVLRPGWKLKGRVLRPAMVKVTRT